VRRSQSFTAVYIGWIVICVALFFGLRHGSDPSRPAGRILSTDAGDRAVSLLRERGIRGYEAVHVAYARDGEGGKEKRWIVLCDRVPHTALRDALVVELRAKDGSLITMRKPVK
jgi:hypothetical protein